MEKLHDTELHGLYLLPGIIRMITPRMRWVVHVVRMGERRMLTGIWWGIKETTYVGEYY
jgi:hypothetical protein